MLLVSHALLPIGKLASQLRKRLREPTAPRECQKAIEAKIGVRMFYGPLSKLAVIGQSSRTPEPELEPESEPEPRCTPCKVINMAAKAQLSNKLWTAGLRKLI